VGDLHLPAQPQLSFAVPVRNGAQHLPRLLDSLRAQDHESFEIVLCDNCSTDGTSQLAMEAASADPRLRFFRNERNIGQIANFNRVFELSRGRYIRWIGADDWLEPSYARRCVDALEAAPRAIGVTTYQDHVADDGSRYYAEYRGPRLDSDRPEERFRRMLWFFTASYLYIDPIYSTLRRSALEKSRRLLVVQSMDQVLAAELALAGPFVHVPACLAHRRKEDVSKQEVIRRYHPERYAELDGLRMLGGTLAAMWESVERAPLGPVERAACAVALARFASLATQRTLEPRVRRGARRMVERVSPELVELYRRSRGNGREEQRT
jgi:glycosyltransferase involved in cell wall biosynthesis